MNCFANTRPLRVRRTHIALIALFLLDLSLIAAITAYLYLVVQIPYTIDNLMRRFAEMFR